MTDTESIGGGFLFGMGVGLLGLGVWGMFRFETLFFGAFALMGFVTAALGLTMMTDRHMYMELGIRIGALGGWVWLTLTWADLITQSNAWILPEPFILALFGLASGGFMVSTFQHVGWIDGPLLSDKKFDYGTGDSE